MLTFDITWVATCTTSFNNHKLAILLKRINVYGLQEQTVIIFLNIINQVLGWNVLPCRQIPTQVYCHTTFRKVLIDSFMANKSRGRFQIQTSPKILLRTLKYIFSSFVFEFWIYQWRDQHLHQHSSSPVHCCTKGKFVEWY